MKSNSYNLVPVWDALVQIYNEFALVCKANGLRFAVDYGTMLGAVRHADFIPWDDDFDVQMPRKDYDIAIKMLQQRLPAHLKVITWRNTVEYPNLFAKIVDTRKDVLRTIELETGLTFPQGLFIDIFPHDGYPSGFIGIFRRKLHNFFFRCYRSYARNSGRHYTLNSKISAAIGWMVRPWFPKISQKMDLYRYYEEYSSSFDYATSTVVGWPSVWNWELWKKEPIVDWETCVMVPFHKIEVPVPANYDAILRSVYGEYMVLPPPEKRVLTHGNQDVAPWRFGPTGA